MKLKYYLRGMGIGIILTAIVMGFALGGRKAALSDAEVIKRAKALGMTEATAEVLTQTQSENSEAGKDDSSTSNQALDQIGEKIPEEINEEIALSDPSVSEVAEEAQEGEADGAKSDSSADEASKEKSDSAAATASSKEEVKETEKNSDTAAAETSKEETTAATEASTAETTAQSDNANAAASTAPAQTTASAISDSTKSLNSTTKTITIPGGLGSDGVASILAREGIIDNAAAFNNYLVNKRVDRIIRSGTKTIPANATYEEIARIITTG